MYDYLSHQDAVKYSKMMLRFQVRVMAAKALFFVSAGIAVLIWSVQG